MNQNNLVSIIIPTKNEGRNIQRCLESCIKQNYRKIEIIVVDNFSKDHTVKIARKFTKKVYLHGNERSAQRNFGATMARGNYLLFLDADMSLSKEAIANCISREAAVVLPEKVPGRGFWSRCRNFEKSLYAGDEQIEAPRFIEKKTFDKIKGYDSTLYAGEDWDLSKRLLLSGVVFGHCKYFLLHHEKVGLVSLIRKKFYYGKNLIYFKRKYPDIAANYVLRLAFIRNRRQVLLNPFLFAGMISIKAIEYGAIALGYFYGFLKNRGGFHAEKL